MVLMGVAGKFRGVRKKPMSWSWLLAFATALTGCTTSLNPGASRIRWVSTSSDVAGCKYLGIVEGSSTQSGTANIATGRNNARNEALNHAAERGATHVHWLGEDESWSGIHFTAEAFDCDRVAQIDEDDEPREKKESKRAHSGDDEPVREKPGKAHDADAPEPTETNHEAITTQPPPPPVAEVTTTSSGSCFFVSPDGIAVTNHHVVAGAATIVVVDAAGARLSATVLRRSPNVDLVVLDVPGVSKHASLPIDGTGGLQLGQSVFTIGFPYSDVLGSDPKFADGSVSGLKGFGDERLLQLTIPVQPGNSGGPVVTNSGVVVGVIVARLNELAILKNTGTLPENVSFAIKSSEFSALLRGVTLSSVKRAKSREDAVTTARAASCQVVATMSGEDPLLSERRPAPPASEPDKDDAVALWTKGSKAFEDRRYEDAISSFRGLVVSSPDHPRAADAQYFLGMAHTKLKEWDQAIAAYQVVVDKYPASQLADDALYFAAVAALKLKSCSEARAYLALLFRAYPRSNVTKASTDLEGQIAREREDSSKCAQ